jgi:hypothetical protein
VSRYWLERALDFIVSDPLTWLRLMGRKAALLVNRDEMLDTESQAAHAEWSWPLAVLQPLTHFGVLVPLAVLGFVATWADRRRLWILHAMVLTYAASTVAFYVSRATATRWSRSCCLRGRRRDEPMDLGAARWNRAAVAAVAANWPMLATGRCVPSAKRTSASRCSSAARPRTRKRVIAPRWRSSPTTRRPTTTSAWRCALRAA